MPASRASSARRWRVPAPNTTRCWAVRYTKSRTSTIGSTRTASDCAVTRCLTLPSQVIAQFAGVREIRDAPAVQVVFRHALFGEALEPIRIARRHRAKQRVAPDFLRRPAVVDFV